MRKYRQRTICSNNISKVIKANDGVTPEEMKILVAKAFPLWERRKHPIYGTYSEVKRILLEQYEAKYQQFWEPT